LLFSFFPLLVFTPVKFISSLPLRSALQKNPVPIPTMLLTGYKASVISIKRYSVGEHRESLCEICGFILLPYFS
jgi:hypothetical protein